MSEENEKTFLAADAAFNNGDLDRWLEFFDPEIEWHDLPSLPGSGVHRGRDALLRRIEELQEALVDFRSEVEEIASEGDRVVARVRLLGAGRASGAPAAPLPVTYVSEFRDGRIIRTRLFADHAEALEAAGLRE
jgi:ketosteroid isomerase-like protein